MTAAVLPMQALETLPPNDPDLDMSQSAPPRLLLVDADPAFLRSTQADLEDVGYLVATARDHDQAVDRILEAVPDAILLGHGPDADGGVGLIPQLRARVPSAAIILVSPRSDPEVAVQAMQAGASNCLSRPLDSEKLRTALTNVLRSDDAHVSTPPRLDPHVGFEGVIGESPAMRAVLEAVRNVAPTSASVMIVGASGTGKEQIASALHRRGRNPAGPFLPINMATLPAELVESTLFGHEKGAFTGADASRIGAFEEVADGTLFLDEITEMPIELQPKLLRVLQERTFRRVGGTRDVPFSARIVCATNRDPRQAVRDGLLREDLFYRLSVVPIELPPLRERPGDLPLLSNHWLGLFSRKYQKGFAAFSPAAMHRIVRHDWPGNVRQLQHAIERAVILHDGVELTAEMLMIDDLAAEQDPAANPGPLSTGQSWRIGLESHGPDPTPFATDHIHTLEELERRAMKHALRVCEGSPAAAARKLGTSTATIYRKMKTYGLNTARAAA